MLPEIQKKYDEKVKRVNTAIALGTPDRVPMMPHPGFYPIFNSGYTVAEVVYDASLEKFKNAVLTYLREFDPDASALRGESFAGEGPVLEIIDPKNMRWAGMPGDVIDKNSIQQFIEYPLLLEDEFDEFFTDRTGWALKKGIPRMFGLFDPLEEFTYELGGTHRGARQMAALFSKPEYRKMIQDMWAINDFYKEYQARYIDIAKAVGESGFPDFSAISGRGLVPFDSYSDFLRGTILTFEDMYERPEAIERFTEESIEGILEAIRKTKGMDEGKHVFIPLHKGMDGFMSGEYYRKHYWSHLQKMILAIIDSGKIPYVYTEGKYDTRIDCLTEVPPGKVLYHFEDVDMAVAKKKLGGIACITGGFPSSLLDWATPDKIRDTAKRLLDDCAPGGGFIFGVSCGLGNCRRENMEALFETVKEYGVY